MAITNFIPKIWASAMLETFQNEAVWATLANRSYQGEATKGNTVLITTAVPVAVKDYKAAGRKTTPDGISTTQVEMLIDQEKNFDFLIDDIDRAQAAGSLDEFARSAAFGLVEDADKFLAALAVTTGTAYTAATPATTGNTAFDLIADLRTALTKVKTPMGGRTIVMNPAFENLLLKSDSKLTSVDVSGTPDGLRNATLGNLLGNRLVVSANLPEQEKPQLVAMHDSALAFVSQIDKTEAMRDNESFSDRLRGLHVYGAKVVRPTSILTWTAV